MCLLLQGPHPGAGFPVAATVQSDVVKWYAKSGASSTLRPITPTTVADAPQQSVRSGTHARQWVSNPIPSQTQLHMQLNVHLHVYGIRPADADSEVQQQQLQCSTGSGAQDVDLVHAVQRAFASLELDLLQKPAWLLADPSSGSKWAKLSVMQDLSLFRFNCWSAGHWGAQ